MGTLVLEIDDNDSDLPQILDWLNKAGVRARVVAETEQRFNERLLRLADNTPDIVFQLQVYPEMQFRFISAAVKDVLSIAPEAFYADPMLWTPLVDETTRQLIMAQVNEEQEADGRPQMIHIRHPDGSVVWLETRTMPVWNAEGRLVELEGVARDVTERVEAEVRLRESEEKFRAVFDMAQDVLLVVERENGRVLHANAQALPILSSVPEALVNQKAADLFDIPEAEFSETLCGIARSGAVWAAQTLRSVNGHRTLVDVTAVPMVWGSTPALLLTLRDVTEREAQQHRLRESETYNGALLDAFPDSLLVLDAEGRVLDCRFPPYNEGFLLPIVRGQCLMDIADVAPGLTKDMAQRIITHARKTLTTGERSDDVMCVEVLSFLIYAEFRYARFQQDRVLVFIRDVTREKLEHDNLVAREREEARREQEYQTRMNMLRMLSHELSANLTIPFSSSEALFNSYARLSEERRRRHVEVIWYGLNHLKVFKDNLDELQRDSAVQRRTEMVDVTALCQQAIDTALATEYGKQSANIISEVNVETARLDDTTVRHILTNLLINAIKYSRAEQGIAPHVALNAIRQDGGILFTVRDNGRGIPEADLPHIFEMGFRGGNTKRNKGSGIGLAAVRLMAEAHRGSVMVESQENAGTTFYVMLREG